MAADALGARVSVALVSSPKRGTRDG